MIVFVCLCLCDCQTLISCLPFINLINCYVSVLMYVFISISASYIFSIFCYIFQFLNFEDYYSSEAWSGTIEYQYAR